MAQASKIRLCWPPGQPRPPFYTKNLNGTYTNMSPKLEPMNLEKLHKIQIDELENLDILIQYYKAFTTLINVFISENISGYLSPTLRMFAQVSDFIEYTLETGNIHEGTINDYVDGIKWVFEECAPEGYVFNGTEYVVDG